MPNGEDIQRTLTAPLAALEELFHAPAEAVRRSVQQLNETAGQRGLPRLPDLPEPPRVFSGSSHRSSHERPYGS